MSERRVPAPTEWDKEFETAKKPPVELVKLPVAANVSLAALAPDWYLFTPALMFIYGELGDRHLEGLAREAKEDPFKLYAHKLEKKIFSPLNLPLVWQRSVWAVPKDQGELLENYMLSVLISNRSIQTLYRPGLQKLELEDPFSAQEPAEKFELASFGVNSNKAQIGFVTAENELPEVRVLPASFEMTTLANKIFGLSVN